VKKLNNKILIFILALTMIFSIFSITAGANYYSEKITLYQGISSNEVVNLQNDLKTLGYFTYHTSTGYFGSITKQAVTKFQSDNGLAVDGIVGKYTASAIKSRLVLKTANSYLGVPYVYGGTSPSGFDCSGFTHYVMLKNGITIPRTAAAQYNVGTWISKSNLKPGDLVFFTTTSTSVAHVGIYLGNNKFIHASTGASKIIVSDLSNTYYAQHYVGAKRII
jgi:cell wall-associated NlpC family hydrolase